MKKKLLVCDIDQKTTQLLSRTLQQHTHIEIILKRCGREVLNYLKRSPVLPDLLLINTLLPDVDGDYLTQIIRIKDKFKGLPIILMSGNYDDIDRLAEAVGASDFLRKPLSAEKVQEKVASIL
ncbi:response regulator [Flavilitoribacter nigricans]|uniref:Response regulatory domain-containing protein n=1 Tax=Flavilitoribacter nigricans (strain ATCC 23147 / DSM 23189 / NBRC 102662 / NCIMB 1420 / SS-2) TaxID=1122177 RepID=A0A2D0N0B1_FLAN2|nr:response regulator [Flavilitoribacter nigricans]PHN01816.1 hypothetical protein CRP01_34825 [Flavilitoribacter nigricans DSM 23189 = NBRC 102662]